MAVEDIEDLKMLLKKYGYSQKATEAIANWYEKPTTF
jgi:hypothetical protein